MNALQLPHSLLPLCPHPLQSVLHMVTRAPPVCQAQVVTFLLETWASGGWGSAARTLSSISCCQCPVLPAIARPGRRQVPWSQAAPQSVEPGVLDLNAALKASMKERSPLLQCGWAGRMGCCLLGWLHPISGFLYTLQVIRMMSPGEQWPLHGSSWGQRLRPESVPVGETWSDTQGRTKGLAAPHGSACVK